MPLISWRCYFNRIGVRVIMKVPAPIGRLIDSRQSLAKSVEIGDPLKWFADPAEANGRWSLPGLMLAAGCFIIDGLRRK
jgi:hypothetical protein